MFFKQDRGATSWDERNKTAERMETSFNIFENQRSSGLPTSDEFNNFRVGNDRDEPAGDFNFI